MPFSLRTVVAALVVAVPSLAAQTTAPIPVVPPPPLPPVGVHVIIQTQFGDIEAVIDTVRAPVSGNNFLRYVDAGHYQESRFHRSVTMASQAEKPVKIEVIQGSVAPAKAREGFPAIPLERTSETGLKHLDGTLSMARSGPNSATSSYFICIGPQPELDFGGKRQEDGQGFAAFGQVISGMDIVRKIQAQPVKGETLDPVIAVKNIIRKK